ncbi:MAG: type II/IV secretion system protein [Candidatus Omnitrophica bacterium]|nr:type II/IV secretion system protein [Candidatus Omnitrophota bacterium]
MNKYAKKSVGEILLQKGAISLQQLEKAEAERKISGESLCRIIPRLGFMTQAQMVETIAEQASILQIDLANQLIDPKIIALVPEELARKHLLIPLFKVANTLTCAMVDVFDVQSLDELVLRTGLVIEPAIATENEIRKALDDFYLEGGMQNILKSMDDNKSEHKQEDEVETHSLQRVGEDAPVIKFINLTIAKAVSDGASDIHIEPEENMLNIRFRVDGMLHQQALPPKQFRSAIIARIKIMASLDIAEHRKPQDGRIQIAIVNKRIDIRVSFLPTIYGENVVMRLLDTSTINLGLEQIGFQHEILDGYRELLHRPHGIILVTGPTGSGKTTTLYSSVSTINKPEQSIMTIEDPVEYRLEGIRQTQVDLKVDMTFARGLRSILRQDPDVIMIGEIRDTETAQIAIQAALTGHLVLATLHTNSAAGAITRLIDIGVEPFLLSSSVIGVVAQRLVRLTCKECAGRGCKTCSMTGYKGRTGIYELMIPDQHTRDQILSRASMEDIHKGAVDRGMKSLRECGLMKVAQGLTSTEEVVRVTQ